MVSCEQGVVKEESQTESKSEPESAKEESESESESKQEYAQKSYGCMRTEPGDCTHSDGAFALPDYTLGVVQADGQNAVQANGQNASQAPVLSAQLQKYIALEDQTNSTDGGLEPEG